MLAIAFGVAFPGMGTTSADSVDQALKPAEATSFKAGPNLNARVRILTVDPAKVKIRIVSVPLELGSEPGTGDHSLRRYAEHLESSLRTASSSGSAPRPISSWAVVNGGFSSSREDIPLGLLVVDGEVYSRLAKTLALLIVDGDVSSRLTVTKGTKSTGSVGVAYSQYKWSGVLCQGKKGGPWDIIPAATYKAKQCYQALQAGPMLVEPDGKVAISSTEPERTKPYARTVVCLSESKLKFVVVQDRVHLLPLAKWLVTGKSKGGPACRVALNLSGDSSSGMAQRQADGQAVAYFGDGTFPIPSAVVVEERRR